MTIGTMVFEGLSEPFTLVDNVARLWSQNITTFYHLKIEDKSKKKLLNDFFNKNNGEIIKAHIFVEHPSDRFHLKHWNILIHNDLYQYNSVLCFIDDIIGVIESDYCIAVRKEDMTSSEFITDFLNITRKNCFFSEMIDNCLEEI